MLQASILLRPRKGPWAASHWGASSIWTGSVTGTWLPSIVLTSWEGEQDPGVLMESRTSGWLCPTSPTALSPTVPVKVKVSSDHDRVTGLSGRCSVEPGSAAARLRLRISILPRGHKDHAMTNLVNNYSIYFVSWRTQGNLKQCFKLLGISGKGDCQNG